MTEEMLITREERKRKIAIALAILESSESDSSDDEILNILLKEKLFRPKNSNKRVGLVYSFSEDEFCRKFRMTRNTCSKLISDYQKSQFYPKDNSHGGTPRTSAENHILSFLKFAGSKTCIHDVAVEFCIAESSFHRQCGRVMNYLNDIAPSVIQFPESGEGREEVASGFERMSGVPGVIGCMKSTYIPMRAPARKNKSSYRNHQQQISITLQGICDPNGIFLDVFTGPPSKIHDAQVFKLSFVYQRLPELCSGGNHLVGDETYPLSNHLMTPFKPSEKMNDVKIHYNECLKKSYQPVEQAFCILKQRFRQLSRLDFHQVDTSAKFVVSCCVLHNICGMAKDPPPPDDSSDREETDCDEKNPPFPGKPASESCQSFEPNQDDLHNERLGKEKRTRISKDLWTRLIDNSVH